MQGGKLVGVLGDEDTVTGFLLAGVGHRDAFGSNFLAVTSSEFVPNLSSAAQRSAEQHRDPGWRGFHGRGCVAAAAAVAAVVRGGGSRQVWGSQPNSAARTLDKGVLRWKGARRVGGASKH